MNANIDFMKERKELEAHELPTNGMFETEGNACETDMASCTEFNPRNGCMDIRPITDITLRAGNRVAAIAYKETGDGSWKLCMLRPIQVGVPKMGALGDLNTRDIGDCDGSPDTVVRFDATLKPATDDVTDMESGLIFGDVTIHSGQTTLNF